MTPEEARRLAGRVIIAGFEGTGVPRDISAAVRDGALGGVILFKRNVESHTQVAELLEEIRRSSAPGFRPIAAVDQEGGRVIRLGAPLTRLPSARVLGQRDDPALTYGAGRLVGLELRACGFGLDFAPVLDVDTRPDSPVIGDRSFGPTPAVVIRHGLSFARGLRDGGVLPCAKHFPGHGDATVDSHLALPRVSHPLQRLESIEIEPFAAWARAGLGPVMTAHVIFDALDEREPATTSRPIVKKLLRGRLNFDGAVFTDDLEMGAIAQAGGAAEAAVRGIDAGVDGVCVCRRQETREAVQQAIAKRAVDSSVFAQKLVRAATRLEPLGSFPGPRVELSWLGSTAHRAQQQTVLTAIESAR